MCTVSWLSEPGAFQLFFNRDERRTRKPALPPAVRDRRGVRFIAPLDGDFGGSWIGVNERGVALCLLNGYLADDERRLAADGDYTSRGLLLIDLIDSASVAELAARLERRDLGRFRSFVLAGFEREGASLRAAWAGGSLRLDSPIDRLSPLVSSSFATEEVRRSRIELFRTMQRSAAAGSPRERLHLDYHASHRPEAGPYSPCMHRPDARTVSFSRIVMEPEGIRFDYAPHSPCRGLPEGAAATL